MFITMSQSCAHLDKMDHHRNMIRVMVAVAASMATIHAYQGADRGFTEIPGDIPPEEASVDLSANYIRDTAGLSRLTFLVELDLTSNHIAAFPDVTSSGSTLLKLVLKENDIREVPVALLKALTKLEKLDLTRNLLTEFPDLSPVASTLKSLPIYENSIVNNDLFAERISRLVELRFINLSGMDYTEMPDFGESCVKMTGILVRNNAINVFDPETLRHCKSIKNFDIAHNKLSSFPDFKYIGGSLESLHIEQNELTDIDDSLLALLISLKTLNLNKNLLQALPGLCSVGETLMYLSISANKLEVVNKEYLDCLVSLVNLTLSYNLLAAVPDVSGPGQTLQRLDLQHNQFTTMPVLKGLGQTITILYMNNNPLMCEVSDDAIAVLHSVEFLYLQGTGIDTVPNMAPVIDTLHTVAFSTKDDPTPIEKITPNNMLALGSIPVTLLESASLNTLPYACIYPSNRLHLLGNPLDLCSCEMDWLLGNHPDAIAVDDATCKKVNWRDFLAANCGRDQQALARDGMMFSIGGQVCPWLEMDSASAEDCLLSCLRTSACSGVRFSGTTCLLGEGTTGGAATGGVATEEVATEETAKAKALTDVEVTGGNEAVAGDDNGWKTYVVISSQDSNVASKETASAASKETASVEGKEMASVEYVRTDIGLKQMAKMG